MKRLRYLPLVIVIGYLLTGVAQIRPEERAVVRRFGQVVARPGPGLWIGFPYPIDRLDRVPSVAVRRVNIGFRPEGGEDVGLFLTGDQNLVNIQVAIDYTVGTGPTDLEDFVAHRDRMELVFAQEAEAAIGEWTATRAIDDVLLSGNASLPGFLLRRLDDRMSKLGLGLKPQQASVAYLAPPDEVRPAFEDVTAAQSNARSQEQRARQEANRLSRDAESQVFQITQQGESYATAKKSIARAEAESFVKRLDQYVKLRATNPDVLTAIWWDEMGRVWQGFRTRGRVELLDPKIGVDGLDLTHIVPPRKR